jgi:chaperonin GroEL
MASTDLTAQWEHDVVSRPADNIDECVFGRDALLRTALQDAASVAGLLVTTEAMVAERPEKKDAAMPADHGNMDY